MEQFERAAWTGKKGLARSVENDSVRVAVVKRVGNIEARDLGRTVTASDDPNLETGSFVAGTKLHSTHRRAFEETLVARDPARYRLIAEHGRGGIGRVVRAEDKELGRVVALKELQHVDAMARSRFVREAMITAKLQHPSIVPIHEAGRWPDGTPFYAMKLVEGESLKARIARSTSLDRRLTLVPNVLAVAEAVAYAHARGIIHRDLKPANIIVGEFGETVVIDWGLAKDLRAEPDAWVDVASDRSVPLPDLTSAGAVLGTPAYMSPEQARGDDVDERGDVFSLGMILLHLLTGRSPYAGLESAEVIRRARLGSPLDEKELPKGAPKELLSIVRRAISFDPDERYANAGSLAEDLRRFQSGQLVSAFAYTRWELVQRWANRYRAWIVSLLSFVWVISGELGEPDVSGPAEATGSSMRRS